MGTLRRLRAYLHGETGWLAAALGCMLILAVTTAFNAFLAGPALKFVFSGEVGAVLHTAGGELRSIWRIVPPEWIGAVEHLSPRAALFVLPTLILATALVKGLAQTGQFFLLGRMSQRVLRRVRADAFNALLGLSPAYYARRAHGDLLSRLTNDANVVEQALFYGVAPLLRDTISVIVLVIFCFVIDPKLALFTFVAVPLAVLPLARFSRWLKRVSRRGQAAQGAINAVSYEALAGVRVVQAFGTEAHEAARLDQAAGRYYGEMLVSYFIRAVRTPTMELFGAIALAALFTFLGYQVQHAGADPAHFISFFVAIVMMYDPLKKLGNTADFLASGSAAAERLFELLDTQSDVRDRPDAKPLAPFAQTVRFEGVHFDYGGPAVLQGIDLELPRGATVALVGSSGSGKSTLASLLPRFYDVTQGRILIDGHDVRDVTLASLRAQISVVSQDTFLFNTTVAENIAYGSPQATDADIRAAAQAAYASEFIERLPQGYATIIGERGITLSGGQRQRLAIARALLRNSPLLILDEATSALDIESERYVQQALEVLMQQRTSLVIAHRLSTVRRAHLIAVLKGGVIVERGRHDELLARGGEYARLHELQFRDEPAPSTPTTLEALA